MNDKMLSLFMVAISISIIGMVGVSVYQVGFAFYHAFWILVALCVFKMHIPTVVETIKAYTHKES